MLAPVFLPSWKDSTETGTGLARQSRASGWIPICRLYGWVGPARAPSILWVWIERCSARSEGIAPFGDASLPLSCCTRLMSWEHFQSLT
jgi:hypothetical protein